MGQSFSRVKDQCEKCAFREKDKGKHICTLGNPYRENEFCEDFCTEEETNPKTLKEQFDIELAKFKDSVRKIKRDFERATGSLILKIDIPIITHKSQWKGIDESCIIEIQVETNMDLISPKVENEINPQ